jgi:hypothetical protein
MLMLFSALVGYVRCDTRHVTLAILQVKKIQLRSNTTLLQAHVLVNSPGQLLQQHCHQAETGLQSLPHANYL